MKLPFIATIVVVPVLAIVGSRASAQIDSSLFSLTWQEGSHWAETLDRVVYVPSTENEAGEDVDVFYWDSTGHIRPKPDEATPDLSLGYRLLTLGVNGDGPEGGIPGVPDDLNDLAMVGAWQLGDSAAPETWRIGLLGGAGTANDGHWTNSSAVYGIGAIDFARQLDPDTALHLGVGYNGNRTYLHDVPLPVVRFEDRLNDQIKYVLGFPTSALDWRPTSRLTIDAEWTLWSRARVGAAMALSESWSVFGEFEHTSDGFFLEDASEDRLFYELGRIMAGVRWKSRFIDLQIGAGWAFDQQLTVGDEIDDSDGFGADIDDGFMIAFTLRGTF